MLFGTGLRGVIGALVTLAVAGINECICVGWIGGEANNIPNLSEREGTTLIIFWGGFSFFSLTLGLGAFGFGNGRYLGMDGS